MKTNDQQVGRLSTHKDINIVFFAQIYYAKRSRSKE